jgi:hypothetical protein
VLDVVHASDCHADVHADGYYNCVVQARRRKMNEHDPWTMMEVKVIWMSEVHQIFENVKMMQE